VNPWLETIAVSIVALLGVSLGRLFSRFRGPCWAFGYLLPFLLIAMMVIVRCANSLAFVLPFSWITAGRVKCVILSLAVPMGLTTLLSRLPRKREKIATCGFMAVFVIWSSILPFLVPALIKDHLLNLRTRVDFNGVCFQTTDYTCGPAAAVTALGKLGLPAHEGEIAVLSHTSPVTGTFPHCLSTALQNRYASDGLKCQYRRFDSLGQLKAAGLTLAIIRDRLLSDHCVAVLGVSDWTVSIADPVVGRRLMSRKQFEKIWRFSGIVLKRDSTQTI